MNFEDLKKEFPELLSEVESHVGEGWMPLLRDLFRKLSNHISRMPEEIRHGMTVSTVKEKFGLLRIYMNQSTDAIELAIDLAEAISARTCEKCGNLGTQRNNGWMRTLCESDYQAWVTEKERLDRKYELQDLAEKQAEKDKKDV